MARVYIPNDLSLPMEHADNPPEPVQLWVPWNDPAPDLRLIGAIRSLIEPSLNAGMTAEQISAALEYVLAVWRSK